MTVQANPKLRQLARLNFHQDWELSDPNPEGIVESFARDESPADVAGVADEISNALDGQVDEDHLRELWNEVYLSNFEPESVGLTYREWFLRMLEILRGASG